MRRRGALDAEVFAHQFMITITFGRKTLSSSITPGGVGMIHNLRRCLEQARRSMEAEAAAGLVAQAADDLQCVVIEPDTVAVERPTDWAPVRSGCAQRKAQFRERVGEKRRERVRLCLAGRCDEADEQPMVCLGRVDGWPCPAFLHGVACAQLKKGHASLGCFLLLLWEHHIY